MSHFMTSQRRHWSSFILISFIFVRNWKKTEKQHTFFLHHFPFQKNDFYAFLYWETFSFLSLSWLWDWQMSKVVLFWTAIKRWAQLVFERTMAAHTKCSEIVLDSKLAPDTTNRSRKDSRVTTRTTQWSQVSSSPRSFVPPTSYFVNLVTIENHNVAELGSLPWGISNQKGDRCHLGHNFSITTFIMRCRCNWFGLMTLIHTTAADGTAG